MTTSLRDLQEQFQDYVISGRGSVKSLIVDAPQISIQQRVDIYREGYYLRLIDILGREFSVLLKLWANTHLKNYAVTILTLIHPTIFRSKPSAVI